MPEIQSNRSRPTGLRARNVGPWNEVVSKYWIKFAKLKHYFYNESCIGEAGYNLAPTPKFPKIDLQQEKERSLQDGRYCSVIVGCATPAMGCTIPKRNYKQSKYKRQLVINVNKFVKQSLILIEC